MNDLAIDFNCDCGPYAFRDYPVTTASELATELQRFGIGTAVVGSARAITFVSPQPANELLAAELAALNAPGLLPAAVLNPEYPGAQRDLQRCAELGFKALKLYPTYHPFDLTSYETLRLAEQAGEFGWPVLVCMRVEDERHHHPLMKVNPLAIDAAITFARNVPTVNVVLCAGNNGEIIRFLTEVQRANVYAELSWIKGPLNATEDMVEKVGSRQLLCGSHLPFLMAQPNLAKIREAYISDQQKVEILRENGVALLGLE